MYYSTKPATACALYTSLAATAPDCPIARLEISGTKCHWKQNHVFYEHFFLFGSVCFCEHLVVDIAWLPIHQSTELALGVGYLVFSQRVASQTKLRMKPSVMGWAGWAGWPVG